MDIKKLETACTMILEAIGENPSREGLLKTPKRFAKAWQEMGAGYEEDFSDFAVAFDGENYDEMIIVKDIEFHSLCEHHLLPIVGRVSVGYIPNTKIIGLSKIPRLVETFARRIQNQERMTVQIAETLMNILEPKGVAVTISATHFCMRMRGIKKQGATMETSTLRGLFKTDPKTRAEFLQMIANTKSEHFF
jgi:GTP cyclohydrolase IA